MAKTRRSTVTRALAEHPRDSEGRIVLGDPAKGCRWCGTVAVKVAADNKAIMWHRGTTCCLQAVQQQIKYRRAEMDAINRKIAGMEAELEHLQDAASMYAEDSRSVEATRAHYFAKRAAEQLPRAIAAINREQITPLKDELAYLHGLEREYQGAAA